MLATVLSNIWYIRQRCTGVTPPSLLLLLRILLFQLLCRKSKPSFRTLSTLISIRYPCYLVGASISLHRLRKNKKQQRKDKSIDEESHYSFSTLPTTSTCMPASPPSYRWSSGPSHTGEERLSKQSEDALSKQSEDGLSKH